MLPYPTRNMVSSKLLLSIAVLLFGISHAWDAGPKSCMHSECNGGKETWNVLETIPKYADSVLPGRVADCPSGYTNNGATCGRGAKQFSAPSRVANCPSGYTNTGLTCYRGPRSYTKCCTTIWSKCRCKSGYTNMGCHCQRWAKSLTSGHMSCPSGYFLNKNTGRCYENCPSGYTNTGEWCHRPVSTLGMGSMRCKSSEERKGARCYPKNSNCYSNREYYLGLCYLKCPSGSTRTAVSTCKHNLKWRGNTHLWMVNRGLDLLRNAKPDVVKFYENCRSSWETGLWDEDAYGNEDSPNTGTQGAHFYNPRKINWKGKSTKYLTYDGSFLSSTSDNSNALHMMVKKFNLVPTFKDSLSSCKDIGKALHYVTDMTMPMHTNGFSGLQSPALLHPYVEAYVPFIQAKYKPTVGWKNRFAGQSAYQIFRSLATESNVYGKNMMNVLLDKGGACTIKNSVAPLPFIGRCFAGHADVNEAIGKVLRAGPDYVASWLVALYNEKKE